MLNINNYQLKPITKNDLEVVYQWRNSEHIKKWMYTDHHISWEEHDQWYRNISNDPSQKVMILYNIDHPLGVVNVSNINIEHSRCYWGFYIGDKNTIKGVGTILGILALDEIFNNIGLRKVCSEVIATNTHSYHYHQKLGFIEEGRHIDHVSKNQQFHDVISMALFSKTWLDIKPELLEKLRGV
ncbi:UDP-4-amino-4,6-dideoxy-N-acetyl-beta-L-altrosamine N-acetyltransferase [Aquibacillus koreensis]|uniref:UDP-4-amino-4, 6-dideoxy-N-acetyl-beta-L-altrosamine N-acetyltransferase n=1 Tax=Aquibacillus koreensis TaxID=279446 RepID=A0A9X4AIV1_9BACI|nr:UDP-4-amino-4,6-dideoxy-N-acetyl-beta-L-altrosamine N-acetyltransferase [Aquibacillus koreensis]MCT2536288.1 UDP-4-amino-4,6-dideoxy-N-acetyl-beta-L-altrosamine N-acetyltransferase [Aquibacillus koreensis]MDC3421361.1 UDP-4-amino-4,6-dideoxy-N-acetyl-beta-L-altrosamine N-acetyltransferase [Aquibacillus koreensis]